MGTAVKIAMLLMLSLVSSCDIPPGEAPLISDTATSSVKGVRYVMSSVSNIERTIEFYRGTLGFEVVARYSADATQYKPSLFTGEAPAEFAVALLKTPSVFIKLVDFDPDNNDVGDLSSPTGPGYTHLCFESSKENSIYRDFARSGLRVISRGGEPVDRGKGTGYAYGYDPDGTMIEIEVHDVVHRPEKSWVGHVANATPDLERMAAFYALLLGYPEHNASRIANSDWADSLLDIDGVAVRGKLFVAANFSIELWQFEHPQTRERTRPATLDPIGYSSVAFAVDDLALEIERLQQSGIRFVGKPFIERGWKTAYAYDPDGTLFSLQQNISAPAAESISGMIWVEH